MQFKHAPQAVSVAFDDPNLVSRTTAPTGIDERDIRRSQAHLPRSGPAWSRSGPIRSGCCPHAARAPKEQSWWSWKAYGRSPCLFKEVMQSTTTGRLYNVDFDGTISLLFPVLQGAARSVARGLGNCCWRRTVTTLGRQFAGRHAHRGRQWHSPRGSGHRSMNWATCRSVRSMPDGQRHDTVTSYVRLSLMFGHLTSSNSSTPVGTMARVTSRLESVRSRTAKASGG